MRACTNKTIVYPVTLALVPPDLNPLTRTPNLEPQNRESRTPRHEYQNPKPLSASEPETGDADLVAGAPFTPSTEVIVIFRQLRTSHSTCATKLKGLGFGV
jgi:hypothetical protein